MSFNKKVSFILILLFEAIILIEAYRGYHPDAEMIDNNGPPTYHERMLLEAAAAKGMDPEAVFKVVRTRQPVFKKENLPNGGLKTSKYYLKPDGSVAVKVRVQTFKPVIPMGDFKPFIRPIQSNRNHPNFFDIPSMFPQPQPNNNGREQVQTYVGPNGERGVIRIWSSGPKEVPYESHHDSNPIPDFNAEPEIKPWEPTPERKPEDEVAEDDFDLEDPEWKEAFGDDSLEKTTPSEKTIPIVTTPKTWSWPKIFPSKGTNTTTFKPQIDKNLITTTVKPSATNFENKGSTSTTEMPLRSLDEFLLDQYGPKTSPTYKPAVTVATTPTNKKYDEPSTPTPTKPTKTPRVSTTTTTKATTTTRTINIDDFDPNKVFDTNGQPINLEELHPIYEKPYVIRNIPKSTLDDLDPDTVNDLKDMGINIDEVPEGTILTKTVTGPDGQPITTTYKLQSPKTAPPPQNPFNKVPETHQPSTTTPQPALPSSTPSREDFSPTLESNENRKPILLPAPPELEPLPLAKPNRPSSPSSQSPPISLPIPPSAAPEDFPPYLRPNTNRKPLPSKPRELQPYPFSMEHIPVPIPNPIEAFLNKIGLTKPMIWERNGRYVETFIDDEGCVLTATFVLSRPMPYYLEHNQPESELEPIK